MNIDELTLTKRIDLVDMTTSRVFNVFFTCVSPITAYLT